MEIRYETVNSTIYSSETNELFFYIIKIGLYKYEVCSENNGEF